MAILTDEQVMLKDAAKGWVGERSPVAALRKLRDTEVDVAFDRAAWAEMGEMGWAGEISGELVRARPVSSSTSPSDR